MSSTLDPPTAPPDGDDNDNFTDPGNPPPANSGKKSIAGAAGIMMAAILLSRILGLVRESVIAHYFGQTELTDIYNAAFTLPDLLFFLIAGGALSGAFIPVFREYIELNKEKEAWRIFSVVASVMLVVVTGFVVFSEIFTPPLVALTSGFVNVTDGIPVPKDVTGLSLVWYLLKVGWGYMLHPGEMPFKIGETVRLTRIVLPGQICFFLGGLMMGSLQARGNPWGQALGPLIYNLFIILGGLTVARNPKVGIAGLCWGAMVGAIVGNFVLQWVLVRRSGGYYVPGAVFKHWRHAGVLKVWKLMLPVILGLALPQVSTIIGKMFAGSLGDRYISALMNGNKLMQVPLGVFAQATAIVLLPVMAGHAARMKDAQQQGKLAEAECALTDLRDSVNYGIRNILFLTIPSSILMWVLALPFVQLVFQSGKFTMDDAWLCRDVLRWFAIGIFAWSAHSIITRGFYALQDSKTPIIVGTLVTVIFIPLNIPLRNWMGVEGLALATTIAATIHMVSMLVVLRQRLRGLDGRRLAESISKIIFASMVTAILTTALYRPLYSHYLQHATVHGGRGHAAVVLAILLPFSIIVYGGLALALHMEEVNVVKRLLKKVTRR